MPLWGLLPLQSFLAFVRFSDRIGSGSLNRSETDRISDRFSFTHLQKSELPSGLPFRYSHHFGFIRFLDRIGSDLSCSDDVNHGSPFQTKPVGHLYTQHGPRTSPKGRLKRVIFLPAVTDPSLGRLFHPVGTRGRRAHGPAVQLSAKKITTKDTNE